MSISATSARANETELWSRALRGDRDAFAAVVGRYRRELQVHCYRMLGSLEDAEDIVQETFLRAWRRRETFRGRSTLRAWLYGIATNACLDTLQHRSRRLLPQFVTDAADPFGAVPPASEIAWLEPYPDRLLDEIVDLDDGPDEAIIARETIELAFLVAIQHLPPRQRAVLILRDVLGWSARETGRMLDMSVIAASSALQRARETLKGHLPERRLEWTRSTPDAVERLLLERYMEAWRQMDVDGLVSLLTEDARIAMPPTAAWYEGREAIRVFLSHHPLAPSARPHLHVPTRANRQPAFAIFVPAGPGATPDPFALSVLRIEDGLIAEIDIWLQPELLRRFEVTPPA
jgi:RNA polymerase sigma-70 factor (ECF subfamily)